MDLNPCWNKKAQSSEIFLEDLIDPGKENREILIVNNSNSIKNYPKEDIKINFNLNKNYNNSNNNNNIDKNIDNNSDSEEKSFERFKFLTIKKDTNIQRHKESENHGKNALLESKQTIQIKTETTQKFQTQTNIVKITNKHLNVNNNETNLQSVKSLSSTNINKKLFITNSEKSEIKNSQITNKSNQYTNNTSKMDSIHSSRRDKQIESSFNAEFDRSSNSIRKIKNKSKSPIISKKKLDKKKLKKMREVDSMRNDLKKWAF